MKFEQVYDRLCRYRSPEGKRLVFLIQEATMKAIYDCILESGAQDCLELGTGYGATSCIIAAALHEIGRGQVTTVDKFVRKPIGVDTLAKHTGLSRHINVVTEKIGYNWYLAQVIARQTREGVCAPCFDFCFLDGAHEWNADALAAFLVAKLLRPGAWLAVDDLDFKLRGSMPGWRKEFGNRSQPELDARQVGMVFELVLKQHPDFTNLIVTDVGRTGWAQKRAEKAAGMTGTWRPSTGLLVDGVLPAWGETYQATDIVRTSYLSPELRVTQKGSDIVMRTTKFDPWFILPLTLTRGRPIDFVSLRIRLLAPKTNAILQVYWTADEHENFSEASSARIALSPSEHCQDISIRINGSQPVRPVWHMRIDPTHGAGSVVWDRLAIGGSHPLGA